ncbi:MAG: type I-B CRISPR-associated protein Cas7/Cst2/DevR [Candidatus Methanoperedens sp.]|nr:type I-B CRISPR-associated protein Cas7/Cst2/DevR [Candidatus Methanoperedens sp.]
MNNTTTLQPSKGLAITYLVRLSIASPSGGRSEIENLNVIKKIREGYLDFPYASSQAMKRALRNTLKGLGYKTSPVIKPKEAGESSEGPARTAGDPVKYIDDDLFGYMEAASKKSGSSELNKINGIRKAVVSMTPLLSLNEFQDNVDFGSNMMKLQMGGNPSPYETEVHRGWYRISLYIELDRIGTDNGFVNEIKEVKKDIKPEDLSEINDKYDYIIGKDKFSLIQKNYQLIGATKEEHEKECYRRAKALLDSIRFLAPSGRSSNWLIDLTPKIMVAAYVKGARTPFLETPLLDEKYKDKNVINLTNIQTVINTFADGIENSGNTPCLVVGYREDLIEKSTMDGINVQTMKSAFETIDGWLKQHFNIQDQKTSSTGQT